jgi:glyoxylase-like metal-dependent hydrolase (beta-lactamase superfamily II)
MRTAIAPFRRFSSLTVSNVYFVDGGPGSRWLVDCGHPLERWLLLAELRASGLRPSELSGVLLTHHHSDHAGNARYLRERFGLKVYAHRDDARTLEGKGPPPLVDPPGSSLLERAFLAVEARFPARTRVDGWLEEGESVAGLEVHAVPGHTEGSVLYRHEATRTLLTGDTVLTALPPLTLRAGLTLAHPAYAVDLARSYASLKAFHDAGHAYDNLLAGHGKPLMGSASEKVRELLDVALGP